MSSDRSKLRNTLKGNTPKAGAKLALTAFRRFSALEVTSSYPPPPQDLFPRPPEKWGQAFRPQRPRTVCTASPGSAPGNLTPATSYTHPQK